MNHFTSLISKSGNRTEIAYDFKRSISEIAKSGDIDTLIISSDGGYAPMNNNIGFLAKDLGYSSTERLGENFKCCYKSKFVEIACVSPLRKGGSLKGVIVCSGEESDCYIRFAIPNERRISRDFFYADTYEAIAYAVDKWGSKKIGITHLCQSQSGFSDVVKCNAEALGHFCDEYPDKKIDSFAFVGCCLNESTLEGIKNLNPEGSVTKHIPIRKTIYQLRGAEGIDVIRLRNIRYGGQPELHKAVITGDEKKVAELLASADSAGNINAKGKDGNTALHIAMGNENVNIIKMLLHAGADMEIGNNEKQSPKDILQENMNMLESTEKKKIAGEEHREIYELFDRCKIHGANSITPPWMEPNLPEMK